MKTIEQIIYDSITDHEEFKLLDEYHEIFFNKPITMDYINYSLDIYNYYKNNDKIETIYESLYETIKYIEEDYNDLLYIKDLLK